MRLGMLGAGYMGALHAAAWEHVEGATIAWVVGRGPERARNLASRFGARATTNVREVLQDPTVDAVDVTAPTLDHPALVRAAVHAGKHVLCETPLARTSSEAEEMVRQAEDGGVHLRVALLHRFAKQNVFVRERVRSGDLGRVRTVAVRRLAPGTGGAHHGDAVEELMLFDLDFLLWTLGDARVTGASAWRNDAGSIRQATALLDCNGARVTVEASFLLPRSHAFTSSVFAVSEGGAVEGVFSAPLHGPPTVRCRAYGPAGAPIEDAALGEDPILAECRHFAAVLDGTGAPGLLHGSHAVRALRLAEAVRAALP